MRERAESMNLNGKILIAMPALGDPRFERSVVLICRHSAEGAMGLIVNKPMPDLAFAALLEHLKIPVGQSRRRIGVHYGGPVEPGRGFVLHSSDYTGEAGATMQVEGGFAVTGTLDILRRLSEGHGPERALLALGYSGWGGGQLEAEIARNDWLTAAPDAGLVFGADAGRKWGAALGLLGIDPLSLSATAGRA
jgi:putative transcriptional regulator